MPLLNDKDHSSCFLFFFSLPLCPGPTFWVATSTLQTQCFTDYSQLEGSHNHRWVWPLAPCRTTQKVDHTSKSIVQTLWQLGVQPLPLGASSMSHHLPVKNLFLIANLDLLCWSFWPGLSAWKLLVLRIRWAQQRVETLMILHYFLESYMKDRKIIYTMQHLWHGNLM